MSTIEMSHHYGRYAGVAVTLLAMIINYTAIYNPLSIIAAIVAIVAGIYTIVSAHFSIREKRTHLQQEKNNSKPK
jgi:hypothetical protein